MDENEKSQLFAPRREIVQNLLHGGVYGNFFSIQRGTTLHLNEFFFSTYSIAKMLRGVR
jgi:hypothetical protein